MKDLYLTSTFRHEWNRKFNHEIGAVLENSGLELYLPHRDTDQTADLLSRFHEDLDGIQDSRMVLAVAENESPNWGAEVGYAYGIGCPVIALAKEGHEIPLIARGMMRHSLYVRDLDYFASYIDKLLGIIREVEGRI